MNESKPERRLREALKQRGFALVTNPFVWAGGVKYTPDVLIGRWIIEVDGPSHWAPHRIVQDKKRDARLRKAGYRVVRIEVRDCCPSRVEATAFRLAMLMLAADIEELLAEARGYLAVPN